MKKQLVTMYDVAGNQQVSAAINKIKEDLSLMDVRLDDGLRCNTMQEYLDQRRMAMEIIDTIISDFNHLVELIPA